jgi:hypothetical protein
MWQILGALAAAWICGWAIGGLVGYLHASREYGRLP